MGKKERSLDEEIALYKKLNQTIYMIVSINRAQKRGDSITVELLNNQVLANFEELSAVPYYSSIKNILEYKKRCEDYLLEKCNDDHEKRSEVIYADNLEYLINQAEIDKEKFNLLSMFTTDSYGWWQTVLGSNLSLDKRSIMYIDILMRDNHPESFINCTEMVNKNINDEIFGYINKTEELKNNILEILINNRPLLIPLLTKKAHINFSYATVNGKSSLQAMWHKSDGTYEAFKTLYDGLSQEDKQESISWIIARSYRDMYKFIKILKLDFKLTKNIIDDITKLVVSDIDVIVIYDIEKYRNAVSHTLIKKASNKKEYKEYKKYVDEFLAKTNYSKIMAEREQEKEKKRLQELLLDEKREELSTLLYNLNEKLQEEVPGKTKIKNINFKR